ncbi:YSIRK-type signal peptide-containing protein [Methylicorpusculum sp.]|uniref:YSIRK-type signal peptide-containing protein n=1 Tax=Methylicorpusculum sp. TaxID=2713644 RepID=UPI003520F904
MDFTAIFAVDLRLGIRRFSHGIFSVLIGSTHLAVAPLTTIIKRWILQITFCRVKLLRNWNEISATPGVGYLFRP